MHGTWVGPTGTVYFNFLHRFTDSGEPLHKVINYPTFLLATGIGGDGLIGIRYATNSELVTGIPNEWEAFLRYTPLAQTAGRPLDLSLHAAWNDAARSGDFELTLARTFGDRLRLLAAGRGFSNAFDEDEARFGWAVGGALQLHRWVALAGDYGELFDSEEVPRAEPAWSAGLQLVVPFTPHTLSLQASNATTTTLEGSALGVSETRWGFEFTIPLTLSRWFGGGAAQAPAGAGGPVAAEVGMTNALAFTPDTVRVRVGETVRWRNTSDIVHTVTADPSRAAQASNVVLPAGASPFDSGDMTPGAVFEQTFTVAGSYRYVCLPHEMAGMVGWIVVSDN
jgi:plastocyanin